MYYMVRMFNDVDGLIKHFRLRFIGELACLVEPQQILCSILAQV